MIFIPSSLNKWNSSKDFAEKYCKHNFKLGRIHEKDQATVKWANVWSQWIHIE